MKQQNSQQYQPQQVSQAGAIGIDLGSHYCVIAVAKKGGVEIILSDSSSRQIPSIVGYGQSQRYIGEAGQVQLKSNFKNTILYSPRFLGIHPNSQYLADEQKWLTSSLLLLNNDSAVFDVTFQAEKLQLRPEQVVAALLQSLKATIRKDNIVNNDYVLTVPAYYTEHEKKALLDACRIAEINCVRLVTEQSAVAMSYGIFRKKELQDEAKHVLFVDFGHSKTSVYLAAISKQKVKILAQNHRRSLGCRDLDWNMFQYYSDKFYHQHQLDPRKDIKSKVRLLDAIEKQRVILSANAESHINIECFMEEEDLDYFLTREEYVKLNKAILDQFNHMLQEIKQDMEKLKIGNDYEVELVGGGTRIPIIVESIEGCFERQALRTLNQTECIARGAAMVSAMISPQFQVTDYKVEDLNYYPIKCQWTFVEHQNLPAKPGQGHHMDIEPQPNKAAVLFGSTAVIPSIKSLTFQKKCEIDFQLFYDDNPQLLHNFTPILSQYKIAPPQPKHPEFHTKVWIKLDENGLVKITHVELLEDYIEEVKVPIKPDTVTTKAGTNKQPVVEADQTSKMQVEEPLQQQQANTNLAQDQTLPPTEPAFEIQQKKRQDSTSINYTTLPQNANTEKDLSQWYELEAAQMNHDRMIKETHAKKNELESYIYDMRGKLKDAFAKYSTPQLQSQLFKLFDEDEQWLYGDGANSAKSQYIKRIEDLHKLGDPIIARHYQYSMLPETLQAFQQACDQYFQWANSQEEKYSHISAADRKPIFDDIEANKQWILNTSQLLSSMKKDQDPPTNVNDVNDKKKTFMNKGNAIMNKSKPAPPKEEPKKEEPKKTDKKSEEQQQPAPNTDNTDNSPMEMD